MPGGGTGGSALAGPSLACSAVYWAGVSAAPAGFSGPVTCVNSPLAWSWLVALASGAGSLPDRGAEPEDRRGRVRRRLREVLGQQRLPGGGVAARGRGGVAAEAGRRVAEHRDGQPAEDERRPAISVGAGCRTMRPATRPQTPGLPLPWMFHGSSFGLPKIARNSERFTASSDRRMDSSAGSRVSAGEQDDADGDRERDRRGRSRRGRWRPAA